LYQQFFNFNTAPFSIAPDPHFIYMSEQHQEGLAHLFYGINQGGGFVALTGEVGTGKTTLCHCLLQQLPDNVEIALVLNPKLNAIELLATICDELHIVYQQNPQTLKGLVDQLNKYLLAAHAKGQRVVLLIDEAQNLSLDVLEQVRLLTNLETSTTKLLQIILLGQPELKQLLEKPALRQLNQRITARYHLMPLSADETNKYIKHRLKMSAGNTDIFNRRAIKKIYALSQGIPRLINIICDRALLGAYVGDTHKVTGSIVDKAATEIFSVEKKSAKRTYSAIFLLIVVIGVFFYYLQPNPPQSQHIILSGSFNNAIDKERISPLIEPKKRVDKKMLSFQLELSRKYISSSLAKRIPQLVKLWGENSFHGRSCKDVGAVNLVCLFDKTDWNTLTGLNRPVIMEFTLPTADKSYALLIGLKQGNPVFQFDKHISFPLTEVLKSWDGHYLMLWQPPVANITEVFPNTFSDVVLWVRRYLGHVKAQGNANLFDLRLAQAVMSFQQSKGLTPDGIIGPRTFIHLKNDNPLDVSPKLSRVN
jgi:general secretion pathway protein A